MLVVRVEAALLYFNVEHVREAIRAGIRGAASRCRLVLFDLSSSPAVDVAGARMLAALEEEVGIAGMAVRLVGARASARDILRAERLDARVGSIDRRVTVADVVEEFQRGDRAGLGLTRAIRTRGRHPSPRRARGSPGRAGVRRLGSGRRPPRRPPMSVLDMIGPVMIGPSSSHTAGACRIGLLARAILDATPEKADITLHGSFAKTGRGHGTDRALVAGLLGFRPDDGRLPDALAEAERAGLALAWSVADLGNVHPNSVRLTLDGGGRHTTVLGSSIGGGVVEIVEIDGVPVRFGGARHTLLVGHDDFYGAIATVTRVVADDRVNIAALTQQPGPARGRGADVPRAGRAAVGRGAGVDRPASTG